MERNLCKRGDPADFAVIIAVNPRKKCDGRLVGAKNAAVVPNFFLSAWAAVCVWWWKGPGGAHAHRFVHRAADQERQIMQNNCSANDEAIAPVEHAMNNQWIGLLRHLQAYARQTKDHELERLLPETMMIVAIAEVGRLKGNAFLAEFLERQSAALRALAPDISKLN